MGSRLVELRRQANSTSWGFTMNGGVDLHQPIFIQKVSVMLLTHTFGYHLIINC